MARMSYVFGDALTGSIIQEIDLQGVSMTRALSGIGEFRGSFGLDQSGKDNRDLIAATEPDDVSLFQNVRISLYGEA